MMSDFSDPSHAKNKLIQDMVFNAIELGFGAVQEVAAKTLIEKPGLSLKEFTKVLDEHLKKQQDTRQSK